MNNRLLGAGEPAQRRFRAPMHNRIASPLLGKRRRHVVERNRPEPVALGEPQHAEVCLAEPRRVREYRLEYRLQVRWRTADGAKDLGGRLLPLQSLAQLAGKQRDLLFVTGRGRFAARGLYRSAPLRFSLDCSASGHPTLPNGLGTTEILPYRFEPSHPRLLAAE
jgi:hypothetical protein